MPKLSIFTLTRNCENTIRRCLASLMHIDSVYEDVDFVFQDQNSSDGTLDLIRGAGLRNYSIHTSDPEWVMDYEMLEAIRNCHGDYIMSCQSDEELIVSSVGAMVEIMEYNTFCSASVGRIQITDIDGNFVSSNPVCPLNTEDYLEGKLSPPFAATIWRNSVIKDKDFPFCKNVEMYNTEMLMWLNALGSGQVKIVDLEVAKYAEHPESASVRKHHTIESTRRLTLLTYARQHWVSNLKSTQQYMDARFKGSSDQPKE